MYRRHFLALAAASFALPAMAGSSGPVSKLMTPEALAGPVTWSSWISARPKPMPRGTSPEH